MKHPFPSSFPSPKSKASQLILSLWVYTKPPAAVSAFMGGWMYLTYQMFVAERRAFFKNTEPGRGNWQGPEWVPSGMGSRQVQMAAVFRWVRAEGKSPIFTIYRKSNHKGRLSLKNSKFLLMTEVKAAIMQYFHSELDKRKVRWQDWDTEPLIFFRDGNILRGAEWWPWSHETDSFSRHLLQMSWIYS